jgi:hypothetical protein
VVIYTDLLVSIVDPERIVESANLFKLKLYCALFREELLERSF